MAKLWRLLSFSIVFAVILGLMMVPASEPQNALAQESDWGFEIQPAKTVVGFNEAFAVNATIISYSGPIAGASMHLDFDPELVECTGITIPDTLPNPPDNSTPDRWIGMPLWNNTEGWVEEAYSTPFMATHYMHETFTFATIHFKSKSKEGTSYLNFNPTAGVETWVADTLGDDYLNWTRVVNGTVQVGVAPTISVSPDSLTFNAIEGGENPPDRTLEICNPGVGTLSWSLSDGDTAWLSETPTSGSLGEDDCDDVTVSVDVTGMEVGDYSATITITGSDEVKVPVNLHIESAAPVEPANLSASSLSISSQQVEPGEQVTISINVANTGGETGSYNAILYINGVVEDNQSVSVAAGTSETVIFTVSESQAGVYDVSLAGQSGQFEVVGGDWVDGDGDGDGGLSTGGIIAIVVAVIVLIVALFFILRRTRGEA